MFFLQYFDDLILKSFNFFIDFYFNVDKARETAF